MIRSQNRLISRQVSSARQVYSDCPSQSRRLLALSGLVSVALLSGCGSDSDNKDKKYRGYMPKFAAELIKASPARPVLAAAEVETEGGSEATNLRSPAALSKQVQLPPRFTALATEEESTAIEFEKIDCTKATDLWNAAPQANNFSNTAFDFIRNLQAQTVFYDCVVREQVFNHSAEVSSAGAVSTVTAASEYNNNSYFASWSLPTSVLNASSAKELQIDSRGILVNLQPGIDSTKTRVDLVQSLTAAEFSKGIRSTLQDRLTNTTNIRSVTVVEKRNLSGALQQQNISGRIIFDNKLSVLAAAVKPDTGAVSYLKQCATSPTGQADDYLRECNADWQEVVYDARWQVITDVNAKASMKNSLNIASDSPAAGAASIGTEQKFYNGENESSFFKKRDLPNAGS